MNKLLKLFCLIVFIYGIDLQAAKGQVMPCVNITVETFPLNPQGDDANYFGIMVTLDRYYDQNITVTGYIYDVDDAGDPKYNTNHPFSLTVTAGNLSAQTSPTFYQTTIVDGATTTTSGISPSTVTLNGLTYNTQSSITGDCPYDDFDGQFSNVGYFHNSMLSSVAYSYTPSPTVTTYEGAIDDIKNYIETTDNASFSSWFTSLGETTTDANAMSENYKYFVDYRSFGPNCLDSSNSYSFDTASARVTSIPDFDASNKTLYNEIIACADSGISNLMTIDAFEASVDHLANVWTSLNSANPSSAGAQLTGSILSIGIQSIQFWRQNSGVLYQGTVWVPTRYDNSMAFAGSGPCINTSRYASEQYFIVAWVAADIAGGIIGAASNAITQYATSGHVGGKGVLIGAGLGALAGSTGLLTRAAGFLSKFF